MKKTIALFLCSLTSLALLAGCGAASPSVESPKGPAETKPEAVAPPTEEAEALEMGEPFALDGGTLFIKEVDGNPMFAPADMADTDHAIAVTVLADPAVASNETLIKSAALKGKDGAEYKLGPYMIKDIDDKTQIIFVFAVPKAYTTKDVTFWLNGEGRKLAE